MKGKIIGSPNGHNPGELGKLQQSALIIVAHVIRLRVCLLRKGHRHRQNSFRLEAWIGIEEFFESPEQQAGTDEQQQSQPKFRDHECALHSVASSTSSAASPALLHTFPHAGPCGVQGWGQTEKYGCEECDRERKNQDSSVDLNPGKSDCCRHLLE